MSALAQVAPEVIDAAPAQQHQAPAISQPQHHGLQATMPSSAVITPADLLRIAMDSGDKDIERLERLMAMDERYRESQERERQRASVLAFRRDFAAFRGENIVIPKSKEVDRGRAGSFMQAEYDQVCFRLSPALSRNGFGFRHDEKFGSRKWVTDGVENDIPWVYVTCFLEHRDGHFETLTLEGPPGDLQANTPVQNMQVTASFFKRHSLLAITGTATGGEDDESRMRKRDSDADSCAGGGEAADAVEQLRDAGRGEALKGMAALTKWWATLDAKQQKAMSPDFGAMRKAARAADEGGAK